MFEAAAPNESAAIITLPTTNIVINDLKTFIERSLLVKSAFIYLPKAAAQHTQPWIVGCNRTHPLDSTNTARSGVTIDSDNALDS
jgi:hypothetical protein